MKFSEERKYLNKGGVWYDLFSSLAISWVEAQYSFNRCEKFVDGLCKLSTGCHVLGYLKHRLSALQIKRFLCKPSVLIHHSTNYAARYRF